MFFDIFFWNFSKWKWSLLIKTSFSRKLSTIGPESKFLLIFFEESVDLNNASNRQFEKYQRTLNRRANNKTRNLYMNSWHSWNVSQIFYVINAWRGKYWLNGYKVYIKTLKVSSVTRNFQCESFLKKKGSFQYLQRSMTRHRVFAFFTLLAYV